MPALPTAANPEALGLNADRLQRAYALLERRTADGSVPAAALCVGRDGRALAPRLFGRQRSGRAAPALRADALFLVASITKPVTAIAVMILAERGELSLQDRVADFVPDFARNGKRDTRLIHLLTHTSGLPDMLPEDRRLRREQRPPATFVERTCRLAPAFRAGTAVSYQSMGFAVLAEVVHQVSGRQLPEFLRRELFEPLGMSDTALGVTGERRERVAAIRVPADMEPAWDWNSAYWHGFGAPWGGLVTSTADLARLALMLLGGGAFAGVRVLSPATVRAMTTNQLAHLPEVPEPERRCRPWGLGWRMQWLGEPSSFGDLVGPRAFGHWGSTGTLCWIDPDTRAFFVLLTTQPLGGDHRLHLRVANLVAAALP